MVEKIILADDVDFVTRLRLVADLSEKGFGDGYASLLREAAAQIESLWEEIDQISADLDEANGKLLEAAAWDSPR